MTPFYDSIVRDLKTDTEEEFLNVISSYLKTNVAVLSSTLETKDYIPRPKNEVGRSYFLGYSPNGKPYCWLVGDRRISMEEMEVLLRKTYLDSIKKRNAKVEFFINAVESLNASSYDKDFLKSLEDNVSNEALDKLQEILDIFGKKIISVSEVPKWKKENPECGVFFITILQTVLLLYFF